MVPPARHAFQECLVWGAEAGADLDLARVGGFEPVEEGRFGGHAPEEVTLPTARELQGGQRLDFTRPQDVGGLGFPDRKLRRLRHGDGGVPADLAPVEGQLKRPRLRQ